MTALEYMQQKHGKFLPKSTGLAIQCQEMEEYAQLHTAELEEERNAFVARYISTNKKRADMEAENNRLREAIDKVMNLDSGEGLKGDIVSGGVRYPANVVSKFVEDGFELAKHILRQALEGLSK